MNITHTANSLDKTQTLAKKFAKELTGKSNAIILFYGQMGTGKTTFTHTLLKTLNPQINPSSPTFSLINQYTDSIYHIDLYRIGENKDTNIETQIYHLGLEEILTGDNFVFIEWAEYLPNKLLYLLKESNKNTYKIEIKLLQQENKREIKITKN